LERERESQSQSQSQREREREKIAKRVIDIPDVHIPDQDSRALAATLLGIQILKPDVVVILGDFLTLDPVSIHRKHRHNEVDIAKEIEEGNSVLDMLGQVSRFNKKKTSQVHYLEGNHEYRLEMYRANEAKAVGGILPSIPQLLRLEQRGYTWWPYEEQRYRSLAIGKILFIHGWGASEHHAKSNLIRCGKNLVYGHTHDHQVYSLRQYGDDRSAFCDGWLGDARKAKYLKNPDRWRHGFGVTDFKPNGNFTHYFIPILHGEFIWAGRIYRA